MYIGSVNKIVTANSAHLCSCKFSLVDKYGSYEAYCDHKNWEVHTQDHDNSNFATYFQCSGCGYQLAKHYWTEKDGSKTNYDEHL